MLGEDREISRASVADLEVSIAEVVDAMEADLETLVASIDDRIMARVQTTNSGSSAPFHSAVRRGVSAGLCDALARLRSQAELPEELPPDLIELARLYAYSAESRAELDLLAAAWLEGQEGFWDHFQVVTERTLADPSHCWEVLKTVRMRVRGHPARLTELFRRACEHELAHGTDIEDSRLRTVLRALEGHWVDPGELGYDLAGHHVALVADTSRSLDAMARLMNRRLLQVEGADGWLWGWLGGRTRMSDGDLDALVASQGASDARVVFGEPAEGLTGFAASHDQALEARAIAVATNKRAVRFADCRVLIAVLRDRDLAKAFIDHELGDITRPTGRMRELHKTLRAYLEHSQSISATAAVLGQRRETIEQQLRSAEQLLQHHVSDRSDAVLIALRVAEILRHRDYSPDQVPAVVAAPVTSVR